MLQQNLRKMNNLLKSKSHNSDNYKRKFQLLRDSVHKNLFDIMHANAWTSNDILANKKIKFPLLSVTSCVTRDRIVRGDCRVR